MHLGYVVTPSSSFSILNKIIKIGSYPLGIQCAIWLRTFRTFSFIVLVEPGITGFAGDALYPLWQADLTSLLHVMRPKLVLITNFYIEIGQNRRLTEWA